MKMIFAAACVVVILAMAMFCHAAEPNCWEATAAPENVWASLNCGCDGPPCECGPNCQCNVAKKIDASAYEWRRSSDGTYAGLYRDGVQVGSYRFADDVYRDVDVKTMTWGDRRKSPIAVPPLLLNHFKETCGGSSSSQSSAAQYQYVAEGPVLTEADASGCQSGSSTGNSSSSPQRGPIRRLLARLLGR